MIAALAVRTGIAPAALLAEDDRMLATILDVIAEADDQE
ncbi:hypothetical protein PBI_SCHIEBS_14 [Gordonia phage Schiebs]|nr:hypothetical protein PBI_SCHIEBS_14 [Gordonia phage Schiebs]